MSRERAPETIEDMHALRRFLQDGIDARGWTPADLHRATGLTRQRIYQMLSDDRDVLPGLPDRETIDGIAKAFAVPSSRVVAVVFEALGYSLADALYAADLTSVSNDQLLDELRTRLGRPATTKTKAPTRRGRRGHGATVHTPDRPATSPGDDPITQAQARLAARRGRIDHGDAGDMSTTGEHTQDPGEPL